MNEFRLVVLLLLFNLSGCGYVKDSYSSFTGGEDNANPITPLEEFTPTLAVKKLWEKSVGDGADEKYLKLEPAFVDNHIYVAGSDGDVTALDAVSGKTVWSKDIDSHITGGPGVGENLVVIGTGEAEVFALDQQTGNELWKTTVSSEILSTPKISENIIVVRTVDGKLFGLNAADGSRLWIYDRVVPALTLRGTSAPVISNGIVIAGFDEGRLAAIELATGKLIWETRIAIGSGRSELERMVDIDSEPVVFAGYIYVATFQGRIAAIDLDSGRITWTRDISSYADIAVTDDIVYTSSDIGEVWALDRLTGNSIWKQDKLLYRAITGPTVSGETVVVGDVEGYLHWLDKLSGTIIGRSKIADSRIIATPVAGDGVLYAYASDGALAAYNYDQSYVASPNMSSEPETPADAETSTNTAEESTTSPEAATADEEKSPEEEEAGGLFEWFWNKVKSDE